jgi:hypothetical protein
MRLEMVLVCCEVSGPLPLVTGIVSSVVVIS